MKLPLNKLSLLIKSTLCTSLLCIASPSVAAKENAPRWFEIEVILFKQLGDKSLLKEHFPDDVTQATSNRSFDLLSDYLQPDISSLKQQLPYCQTLSSPEKFSTSDFIAKASHTSLSLYETQSNFTTKSLVEIAATAFHDEKSFEQETEKQDVTKAANTEPKDNSSDTLVNHNTNADIETEEALTGLSAQQIQLIAAAEQQFSPIQFKNYSYYPKKLKQSKPALCQIPESFFEQVLTPEQLASFNIDALNVERLSGKLAASGVRNIDSPYLISKDSLRLTDVTQRLRWSKNFKPLLHLGWRQIGVTRTKAAPMKLFAGKHFALEYQQQLKKYQNYINALNTDELKASQINALSEQLASDFLFDNNTRELNEQFNQQSNPLHAENTLLEASVNQRTNVDDSPIEIDAMIKGSSSEVDENELVKQKQINAIVERVNQLDTDNIEQVISQLNQPINFASPLAIDESSPITPTIPSMPTAPKQDWELAGLFKVHLDHYLYITADLTLLTDDLNTQSQPSMSIDDTHNAKVTKQISFQQNRRVISGEVHYFDHPYIGMLVQIRRFDPSKSDDEAVTQAIR